MDVERAGVADVASHSTAATRDSRSIRIATTSRMTELFCELQQSRGGYDDNRGPGRSHMISSSGSRDR